MTRAHARGARRRAASERVHLLGWAARLPAQVAARRTDPRAASRARHRQHPRRGSARRGRARRPAAATRSVARDGSGRPRSDGSRCSSSATDACFIHPDGDLRFFALTGVMGDGEMGAPEHPGADELARLLLARGANPNDAIAATGTRAPRTASTMEGVDAFVSACNLGDRERAAALLDGHPEYLEQSDPLIDAASHGRRDAVAIMLALGFDPNRPGQHGHLPLHNACKDRAMSELLLAHGADPRARVYGGTAAEWARHADAPEMARFFAEHTRDLLDAVLAGQVALATELL